MEFWEHPRETEEEERCGGGGGGGRGEGKGGQYAGVMALELQK